MFNFAQVRSVEANVATVILVSVDVRVILVSFLRLNVLYQVESNACSIVGPWVVVRGRLGSSHVQWSIAAVVIIIYAVAGESVPFFLSHFLFILCHQFPFREVFLILLIVQHFAARVDLLNAKLRRLVVVVGDVNVVVVDIQVGCVWAAAYQRRLRFDVMPNVLPVLVDDVVGVLEVTWGWLSHMARIVELLLLLLELKSLLLLLLTVLRCIAVLFALSFTLPFLVVRCALRPIRQKRTKRAMKKKLEILEFHS